MGPAEPQPELDPGDRAAAGSARIVCPRCDALLDPGQEYCLECGLRLPQGRGGLVVLREAWGRRIPWYPGDWIFPALAALAIAAAAAFGLILWGGEEAGAGPKTIVATTAMPSPAATESVPVTPTDSTATTTTQRPPAPRTRPRTQSRPRAPIEWPAGRSGYTIVVASLPAAAGRAPALARAREASRAGLTSVGVLDSSEHPSLHPGYYVVFSGIYETNDAAQEAVPKARDAGFERAYARQVTS